MTTVYEMVADALDNLSPAVPFAMAPYKSANGILPDVFIVYQLIAGTPEQHADDAETERSYLVQVSIYSRSGLASLPDVDGVMISAGFVKDTERQLPQDSITGHYGLAIDYVYM